MKWFTNTWQFSLLFSSTSSHFHPLQVENCDSNLRLVVGEGDNVKSGLRGLKQIVSVPATRKDSVVILTLKVRR